jgi:hypothetical protein
MVTSLKLADVVAGALGLSAQTVVQHVKNLQAHGLLLSTGRGRGAAQMRPIDAARLVLAAAGSDLVKDSVETVESFGGLLPIGSAGAPGTHIRLEDHLAGLLTDIAARLHAGEHIDHEDRLSYVGLSLLSAASIARHPLPQAAVARRILARGVGAISFATGDWLTPEISATAYAARVRGAGLVRERHVTIGALERIASNL